LELSTGREVIALIKAPAVFLLADRDNRASVSNHLTGVVSRIHRAPVNTEVVVDLPLARVRHITAVVTTQAVASLRLSVRSAVTVALQASSAIVASFG
jgi:molybdate transport system regulatory protein